MDHVGKGLATGMNRHTVHFDIKVYLIKQTEKRLNLGPADGQVKDNISSRYDLTESHVFNVFR